MRLTRIELSKEDMKFSAGHFTIFSATERENLHGHNFRVSVCFEMPVVSNGMGHNYIPLKKKLRELCASLDEKVILPSLSKFLKITEEAGYVWAHFHDEKIPFLKRDVLILPIENTTLEEFSRYLCEELSKDTALMGTLQIQSLEVKVSSGDGQWANFKKAKV